MRKIGALFVLAVVAISIVAVSATISGNDAVSQQDEILLSSQQDNGVDNITSVCGFVYDFQSKYGRIPLEGMRVSTWVDLDVEYDSVLTDDKG